MKLEYDGKWKLTDDNGDTTYPTARTLANTFNRVTGENTRLKRDITRKEEDVAKLKAELKEAADQQSVTNGRRWPWIVLGIVIGVVFAGAIAAFLAAAGDWLTQPIELTPALIAVLAVLFVAARWLYVQYKQGEALMPGRLRSYGRNNQESSDSDQTDKNTQPGILHKLGIRFTHRGGES